MLNNAGDAGDTCNAGDLVIDGSAGDLHLLPYTCYQLNNQQTDN